MATPDPRTTDAPRASPLEDTIAVLELDAETARRAHQRIQAGEVCLLLVSGKIASGKDTIAPLVLQRLGYEPARHLYWADALKNEVDVIMADVRSVAHVHTGQPRLIRALSGRSTKRSLAQWITSEHAVPAAIAEEYVSLLWPELLADPRLHARARTPGIRRVLQLHGTEVRRSVDPKYWIKQGLAAAVTHLAAGESVYFTDSRFPNEVELPRALGAVAVRLDVSPEVQHARLQGRDGIAVDEAALTHVSETSLDEFRGFDVRISNEGSLEEALAAITAALPARQ